jgi:hypothetical protein
MLKLLLLLKLLLQKNYRLTNMLLIKSWLKNLGVRLTLRLAKLVVQLLLRKLMSQVVTTL